MAVPAPLLISRVAFAPLLEAWWQGPTIRLTAVSPVVRISSEGAPLTHMERDLSHFTSSSQ